MHCEIAVAEPEPGFAAELFERGHERPGLIAAAPTGFRVVEPGEHIGQRVEIGCDMEPEVLEIVPVLATTVSLAGGRMRARPSASLAPPTPPESARTGRSSLGRSGVAASAIVSPEQIFRRGADQRASCNRCIGQHESGNDCYWVPLSRLSHDQGGGGRDLIGKSRLGELKRTSMQVRATAQVPQ